MNSKLLIFLPISPILAMILSFNCNGAESLDSYPPYIMFRNKFGKRRFEERKFKESELTEAAFLEEETRLMPIVHQILDQGRERDFISTQSLLKIQAGTKAFYKGFTEDLPHKNLTAEQNRAANRRALLDTCYYRRIMTIDSLLSEHIMPIRSIYWLSKMKTAKVIQVGKVPKENTRRLKEIKPY